MERKKENSILPDFDSFNFEELRDRSGVRVVPALIINFQTGKDLGLVYVSRESYRRTTESGVLELWSRSRGKFWLKGETSGNKQIVRAIRSDCENNMLRIFVDPLGPFCHRGTESCFDELEGGEDN